jgi:hypothetical protein
VKLREILKQTAKETAKILGVSQSFLERDRWAGARISTARLKIKLNFEKKCLIRFINFFIRRSIILIRPLLDERRVMPYVREVTNAFAKSKASSSEESLNFENADGCVTKEKFPCSFPIELISMKPMLTNLLNLCKIKLTI